MKRKSVWLRIVMCMLAVMMVIPSVNAPAMAASKLVKLYKVIGTGVRVRETPDGYIDNVMGRVDEGEILIYLGRNGNWYQMANKEGKIGYIFNRYLSYYGATTQDCVGLTTSKLHLRKAANHTARSLKLMKVNTVVIVKNYNEEWAYVQLLDGTKGYCAVNQLKRAYDK